MDTNLILKIAALGILVSVVGQILKASGREDQAFLAGLAGLIIVLSWVLPVLAELFALLQGLFQF